MTGPQHRELDEWEKKVQETQSVRGNIERRLVFGVA